jgi:site-specific DNA recombinase
MGGCRSRPMLHLTHATMELDDGFKEHYLIYNRKSTDDAENQRNSLAYQRQRNLEFAQRQTLAVAASFTAVGFCANGIVDESHSGFKEEEEFDIRSDGSVQYRILGPKFLKLAELLKERKIKGAIFLCWDRASRNPHDDLILKKLSRMGCDIRFAEASYDNTSAGELHRDIDGVFATHYSRSISEKVKNAQRKLRSERRCIYSAPVGYLDRGSDSKPFDPERAPIVKRIFELYATGEWSIRQLANWAREQGLTKKPIRRRRSPGELAQNVDASSVPKVARPVDHKTIEYMLPNPFYIGKIKSGEAYVDSAAHQALIDTRTFYEVQEMLRKKRVSVHYVYRPFFAYRGLVRCGCGRLYTPYLQKGIVYYRSRCKSGCGNKEPNLSETDITAAIQSIMDRIRLSDEELAKISQSSKTEIKSLAETRNRKLADLQAKQRAIIADLDYVAQNKITLLRTGAMNPEAIDDEKSRLERKLAEVNAEITIYAESVTDMLKCILTFSELVRNAGIYFRYALDSERREIALMVLSELKFTNREITSHEARDGFGALLSRGMAGEPLPTWSGVGVNGAKLEVGLRGSPLFRTMELHPIYKKCLKEILQIRCIPKNVCLLG